MLVARLHKIVRSVGEGCPLTDPVFETNPTPYAMQLATRTGVLVVFETSFFYRDVLFLIILPEDISLQVFALIQEVQRRL